MVVIEKIFVFGLLSLLLLFSSARRSAHSLSDCRMAHEEEEEAKIAGAIRRKGLLVSVYVGRWAERQRCACWEVAGKSKLSSLSLSLSLSLVLAFEFTFG